MYSADRWDNVGKNTFTYTAASDAQLEIEFNTSRHLGKMTFDNWYIDKNTIDELIEVLQQVKLYMP